MHHVSLKRIYQLALVMIAFFSTAFAQLGNRSWNFDHDRIGELPPHLSSTLTGQGKVGEARCRSHWACAGSTFERRIGNSDCTARKDRYCKNRPGCSIALQAAEKNGLRLVQSIPLPNVEGRIDHFGVDVQGQRLFVAALGNNTLEVIDLRDGKRLTTITGLKEPQGVLFIPGANKLFVANTVDGTCRMFDGSTYKPLGTADFSSDADNIRYDAGQHQVYVGYGEGALGILDPATGQKLGDIPLPGHPESFRLETSGSRIFVNVPSANHTIAVVDRSKHSVVATWSVGAQANFPMTLDETNHRLMVVTRRPARLIVLNTQTGKSVASLPAVGDSDDVFYDPAHRRIYATGGEGFIDMFDQRDPDHYQPAGRIPTASGARTSLFVPEFNRLYVAVPHRGNQKAEIRVYEAQS